MENHPNKSNHGQISVKEARSFLSSGSRASWRVIPLTQGKSAIVDAEDYEWLNQWKWFAVKSIEAHTYYAVRFISKGKTMYIHRQIMKAKKGQEIDHINHNGLNNRKFNLRFCTSSQNHRNQKPSKSGTSCYKGVSSHKKNNKWQVHIWIDGKNKYLGCYDNEIMAAKTYDKNALELFGEFACVNISA